MKNKQSPFNPSMLDELNTSGAGYDILRYISLPDVLGTESETLLYFMGKHLARQMPADNMNDLYVIFDKMGWGRLDFVKETKKELTFTLMSDPVVLRLNAPFKIDFRLEAGFLAEALTQIKGQTCECTESINEKIHQIVFSVVYTEA